LYTHTTYKVYVGRSRLVSGTFESAVAAQAGGIADGVNEIKCNLCDFETVSKHGFKVHTRIKHAKLNGNYPQLLSSL
jgi:hypothetical protein